MTDFDWTADALNHLKKLWREGQSMGAIAGILNTSRNTIAGKLHRLGLNNRGAPEALRRAKNVSPDIMANQRRTFNRAKHATDAKAAPSMPAPKDLNDGFIESEIKISFDQLGPKTCRYPYGDEMPFTYCGQQTIPPAPNQAPRPYCPHHEKLCNNPPRNKRIKYNVQD